jgi:hypothetical protein
MRSIDDLYVGWLETSIGVLVREDPLLLALFPFVLITSVDSTTELADSRIGQAIVRRNHDCAFIGQGLLVPSVKLPALDAELGLFHGFDEVWALDDRPAVAKPSGSSIVGPLNLNEDDPSGDVAEWMNATGCRLGLGDGFGLNYVTSDAGLAEQIERRTTPPDDDASDDIELELP